MAADARSAEVLHAALGVVRGVTGALVSVEILTARGGGVTVDAQALHTVRYAAGDRVLVIFQSDDMDSAVVVGRVGNPADAPTSGALLALLLSVDGAGSALDADLVDGQHEAALLRADGSRALTGDWDAGSGRTIKTAMVRARSSDGLALTEDAGALGLFVADGGNVGVGTNGPLARLHVSDGTGCFLFGSLTSIGATAQVIVPNGAGDVTIMVRVEAVVSNGTAATYSAFGLTPGGVMTQNATIGSDTYQFRLNSDGSLDVRRTAGSNAGKVIIRAMWG